MKPQRPGPDIGVPKKNWTEQCVALSGLASVMLVLMLVGADAASQTAADTLAYCSVESMNAGTLGTSHAGGGGGGSWWLFDTTGFPRRWDCGAWAESMGWLHILSDIAIWGAYMAIPCILAFFLYKRRTPLPLVTWLFIAFIALCGIGHLLEAIIFWHPIYRFAGVWKLCTAIVSWMTVIAMIPLVPKVLRWPTLDEVNKQLEDEIRVRKETEKRLQESAIELTLQKNALDEHAIVAITDPAGVITYVNDKFCKISKYEREDLIGQTHRIINSGYHPKEFFISMWRTIASGETWRGEICNRAKDGSIYWVDTTIVPFKDASGSVSSYVAIRADITDRKRAEQLIEQANIDLARTNAEIEQFVYTVSHDLKTPLVTIHGYAGILREDIQTQRPDRLDGFVNHIVHAVDRMKCTIDDLLELIRVGRVAEEIEPINLHALASGLVDEMSIQILDANAVIRIQEDTPELWGDFGQIHQMLENLIVNALKYAGHRSEQCEIRIGAEEVHNEIRIIVSDNGPGIAKQYHDKIFNLFQRLDTESEGSGIGLTIVKRVAELHGGRVWVESKPGEGAAFIVSLPSLRPSAKYTY